MLSVKVTYDKAKLARLRKQFTGFPGAMGRVMPRAINKTAASARTKIVQQLSKKIGFKQKAIRAGLFLKKANRAKWRAIIDFATKGVDVSKLAARQTKKGVTYSGPADIRAQFGGTPQITGGAGTRKLIPRAFTVETSGGKKIVFRRKTKGDGLVARLPLTKLFTKSLSDIFKGAPALSRNIQKEAGRDLEKNIDTQVGLYLEKKGAAK